MKIYTDNTLAAQVVHPGFAVADELEALGIGETEASTALELTRQDLARLCKGELEISAPIAAGLERLGSANRAFWLQLQSDYTTHPKRGGFREGAGRKKKDFISRQVRISAPPEEMERIQLWLKTQPNTSRALADLILRANS